MTATRERLLELLTDRALVGLGPREQIELAELLVQAQDVDVAAFDAAASAVALASLGPIEPMPAGLAGSIEARAMQLLDGDARPTSDYLTTREIDKQSPKFAATQVDPVHDATADVAISADFKRTHMMEDRPVSSPPPAASPRVPTPMIAHAPMHVAPRAPTSVQPPGHVSAHPHAPLSVQPHAPSYNPNAITSPSGSNVVPLRSAAPRGPSRVVAIGGWLAAAVCLVLAIGAFLRRPAGPVAINTPPIPTIPRAPATVPVPVPVPTKTQTPAELREALLASVGSTRTEWSATKDPAGKGATGEVVWNKEQQKGTMRFRGLAKNDPKLSQYQLWIFDKTRDDKFPVDGGVFDVDSETGDVVVAIHATLPVATPTLFAVTIEKPGGVVVSKRERIVVTAKLGG